MIGSLIFIYRRYLHVSHLSTSYHIVEKVRIKTLQRHQLYIIICVLLILCASTKLARRQGGGKCDVETFVDTALFNVFLEFSKRISFSICKPQNYLDFVTSKGKGPGILDVSAMLALQTRVTL